MSMQMNSPRWSSTSLQCNIEPHLGHIGRQTEEKWWRGVAPIVKHTNILRHIFYFGHNSISAILTNKYAWFFSSIFCWMLIKAMCVTSRQLYPDHEEDEETIGKADAEQPVQEKWWPALFSSRSLGAPTSSWRPFGRFAMWPTHRWLERVLAFG